MSACRRQRMLRKALRERDGAERAIATLLQNKYPVGAPIEWEGNRRLYSGVVVSHGYHDRIKVRNAATGRDYWIYAWRITS